MIYQTAVYDYFDALTPSEADVWYPTPYSWNMTAILRLLNLRDRTILDVGCGAGNLGLWAASEGATAFASDISVHAVEVTKKHARALNLEIRAEQSSGLDYWMNNGEKFDIVICNPPSLDILSRAKPARDPFFNSYFLIEILDHYEDVLNNSGCFLSVVSGEKNMEFVSKKIRDQSNVQPFVQYKEVPVIHPDLYETGKLVRRGLMVRKQNILYWRAYYFGIFRVLDDGR